MNFTKPLRKILPIFYNLFQELKVEEILPNSFYEASITLIPKPNKGIVRKENCKPISLIDIEAKRTSIKR